MNIYSLATQARLRGGRVVVAVATREALDQPGRTEMPLEMSGHEGKGYRAGTGRSGDHPKRAMPKLHRHQATRAAGVSISPSVALPRSNRPCVEMPLEGVPEE